MEFVIHRSSDAINPFVREVNSLRELCNLIGYFESDIIIRQREDWEKELKFEDVDFALEIYDDWRE